MSLLDEVRALVDEAGRLYAGTDEALTVAAMKTRLDEPLRVAIAGKVKAGKSTLLNALVGERLAPTDAREYSCTPPSGFRPTTSSRCAGSRPLAWRGPC